MNEEQLETKRLRLRPFVMEDEIAFFDIMRDETVNTYLPWFPITTHEEAKKMLEKKFINMTGYHYAICLKKDNIAIGYVNVSDDDAYDVGYGLRVEYWHQGIVSEAVSCVIEYIKDKVPFITATHDILNPHSGHVMKKVGMRYQYSYVEQWMPKNRKVTFRMYQRNFDPTQAIYQKYWDIQEEHFIEKIM